MIEYSDNLIKNLEEILRAGFGQPMLVLNRRSDRSIGPFHITIQESYAAGTREKGGRYICQVGASGVSAEAFYFGLVLRFGVSQLGEKMNAYVLDHSSLSIFQSYPAGDLYPVIRAEWDWNVVSDPKSGHAQPHWHFTQSAPEIERIVRTLGPEMVEFGSDLVFDRLISLADIHFAMNHLRRVAGVPDYKHNFATGDDFTEWFRELVVYLSSQLAHACGGRALAVADFKPANSLSQ
ncbi:MAG: hypothetical protein ABR976_16100 [Terracidiphilus sp.]|jgi:hypothetical protein